MEGKPERYLYDYVKKKVDLAEFLETEIGCDLKWFERGVSAATICPMPHHSEDKPSFRIKYVEENGVWIFNCFGCGAKGTVIDFFEKYYGINNPAEALVSICRKFGFKKNTDLVISCLKDIKKKINFQKKIEFTHIVSANQCRMLLRKDYKRNNKWVRESYKKMNEALTAEDMETIEGIGNQASIKMRDK